MVAGEGRPRTTWEEEVSLTGVIALIASPTIKPMAPGELELSRGAAWKKSGRPPTDQAGARSFDRLDDTTLVGGEFARRPRAAVGGRGRGGTGGSGVLYHPLAGAATNSELHELGGLGSESGGRLLHAFAPLATVPSPHRPSQPRRGEGGSIGRLALASPRP